jgi:activator of HSP90 ATPase
MTGSPASASAKVGAEFNAWDGYIHGRNLELERPGRIVQSWRSVNFADSEPDSRLVVRIELTAGGSRITLVHSDLPAHGDQYRTGWGEHYFEPMQNYFAASVNG